MDTQTYEHGDKIDIWTDRFKGRQTYGQTHGQTDKRKDKYIDQPISDQKGICLEQMHGETDSRKIGQTLKDKWTDGQMD